MEISATPRLDILLMIIEEMPNLVEGFIAHRVFPYYSVDVSTGPIPKILARRTIQRIKKARYGGFPRGVSEATDGATFDVAEEGFEEPYDAKDLEVYKNDPDRLLQHFGARSLQTVMLVLEKALSDVLMTTSTFGAGYNTAGAAAWDNASGKPLDDVAGAADQVEQRIGMPANTLIVGGGGYLALRKNAQVQDDIKDTLGHTSREGIQHKISASLLAEVFGLEQVLIGRAVYNTADEGQTESLSRVWPDDKALVCYVPPSSEITGPGLGRTFFWEQGLNALTPDEAEALSIAGLPEGIVLEEYQEPGATHGVVRSRVYQDQLLLNKDAGHLITGL